MTDTNPPSFIVSSVSSAERPLADFLQRLASVEPTPGGGSAAALAGALAAALVSMVCRLTLGKEKFAAVAAEMRRTLERAEALRRRLTSAVDEDAQAYEMVLAAYRMPRSDEGDKQARSAAIQAALREAIRVPLNVARDCAQLLDMARFVAEQGNPNAASDAHVAALLAEAGLRGAIHNVRVNLPGIKDTTFADHVRAEVEKLLAATDLEIGGQPREG